MTRDLKYDLAVQIYRIMRAAEKSGIQREEFYRSLGAELLLLSAEIHTGTDASFLQMAKQALALVRTGAVEQ